MSQNGNQAALPEGHDNPYLYPKVEGEIRRANLNRFPFSLFYVIDGEVVNVLSCFHQYRDPKSRDDLLNFK